MPIYFWNQFLSFVLCRNKISTMRGEHQQFALAFVWREIFDHDAAFSWLASNDNRENCDQADRDSNATQRTNTDEDSCFREKDVHVVGFDWRCSVCDSCKKNKQTSVQSGGKKKKITPRFLCRRRTSGGVRGRPTFSGEQLSCVCVRGPRQCYWHLDRFAKLEK